MAISLEQFVQQLTESGIYTAPDLQVLLEGVPAHSKADGEVFARELVRQKKLTGFQAQQIYGGRGKALVLGNYVVLDKLGQGGMGMVLKARHRRMDRIVALKVMSPEAVKSPDAVKRFHREAQAAAKLDHPNIVTAYDADEAQGTHFLVMQFVEGSDLSAIVKKNGPLAVDQALRCILQAARGLEYAHQHGVIHRDIKPANLLMDAKGVVRILDMGLARIEGQSGAQAELTNTGAVMGTVDYMAPEQALSTKSADARSDVYSLGISLWYLLTGTAAYEGDSLMAKLLAHRDSPIPSLSTARSDVPVNVDLMFQKIVAKQPQHRYQTMTDVIRELEAYLSGQSTSVSPTVAPGAEDSELKSFLLNLEAQPSTSANATRTRQQTSKQAAVSPAAEATMVSSDTQMSLQPGIKQAAQPVNRTVLYGGIGAAAVLILGLVWFLIPPTNKKSGTASSTGAAQTSKRKSKIPGISTAKTDNSPAAAKKEALDWLFAAGAKVGVGQPGSAVDVQSTAGALATGKPVVYVTLTNPSISDQELAHLTAFPTIWNLSLHSCNSISDDGIAHLAALEQLYVLSLDGTRLTDRGLVPLLKCRSLEAFHLGLTQVTSEGMPTIGKFSGLVELNLGRLPISGKSLRHLQTLKSLQRLDLDSCDQLTDLDGSELARLPALDTLQLTRTAVTDKQLQDLSKSPKLRSLTLESCPRITDAAGPALAQFPALETLFLGNTQIGDEGLRGLANSTRLRTLHLNGCDKLTAKCGTILTQFPVLENLDLNETGIDDSTLQAISRLPKLKTLQFINGKVTDAAIPSLIQLKSLVALNVTNSQFSADGVKQLVAAMPWCEIDSSHGHFAPTRPSDTWTDEVAAMLAAQQLDAVVQKLKELNPGFDGKIEHHRMENGELVELRFVSHAVTNISPVRALPKLKVLYCDGIGGAGILSDLTPLKGLQLDALHVQGTRVADLSPLRGMPLRGLSLFGTSVSDLSPLADCKHLAALDVSNSKVTAEGVAALQKALPDCRIESNAVPQPAAAKTIDLLALADVQRDGGVGTWKQVSDGIACAGGGGANVLQLPYEPPEEYDFEIEFTTTGKGLNVNQYLAAQGRMFAWKLNSHNVSPPLYGFELLDGKYAKENKEAAMQIPTAIQDGQRYRSTIEVRRKSLRTLLDGKELVNWSGDFQRLSMESSTPMRHAGRLGIGSWRRPVTFHVVTVREVSGSGKIITVAAP